MKKQFRKAMAFLLTMVMVLGMTVTAMAEAEEVEAFEVDDEVISVEEVEEIEEAADGESAVICEETEKTVSMKEGEPDVSIHPAAEEIFLNTQHFDSRYLEGLLSYDDQNGLIEAHLNKRAVLADLEAGQRINDLVFRYYWPESYSDVTIEGDAFPEDGNAVFVLQINTDERNGRWQRLLQEGMMENPVTVRAAEDGKSIAVTYTINIFLEDFDYPSVFYPDESSFVKETKSSGEMITYLLDGEALSGEKKVLTGIDAPGNAVSCTVNGENMPIVDGKLSVPTSILKEDDTPVSQDTITEYKILWFDSENANAGETRFRVAIRFKDAGEVVPMTPFGPEEIYFRIINWPEGEKDPFTVEYKDDTFHIHMNMTRENWQKAYDIRNVGESSLALDTFCSGIPSSAETYAIMSSGDVIAQGKEKVQEVVDTLTKGGSRFREVNGERLSNGRIDIAEFVERADTAAIIPISGNGCMKSVAWKDRNGYLINVGETGTVSYVKYARIQVHFDDPSPVDVQTSDYRADGSTILVNHDGIPEKYFFQATTLENNSVNYYLDGAGLEEDRSKGNRVPEEICTGYLAPEGAVGYEIEYAGGWRESGIFQNGDDGVAEVRTSFTENGAFTGIFESFFRIIWKFNGFEVKSKSLGIRVTVWTGSNDFDENGWRRIEKERIGIPDDIQNESGIRIEAEDGHLNTAFTGDPVRTDIWEEYPEFSIAVPEASVFGKEPSYYELATWEGQNRFDNNGNLSEIIGFGERLPLNGAESVSFPYPGYPDQVRLVEDGDTYEIYKGARFGLNEDCAAWRFVQWYDENENYLGTEWIYITVDPCYKENVRSGMASVAFPVEYPTVLRENARLRVREYITDSQSSGKGSRYFTLIPVDEKGFEVNFGAADVMLPYPEGITIENAQSSEAKVFHYEDDTTFEKADITYSYDDFGIRIHLEHFSPFLLLWEEPEEEPGLTGLEISSEPKKTVYTAGESFDKEGMEILAVFSDGMKKPVTDYTVKPSGKLSVSDTCVEISYTVNGVTKTITQEITVKAADSPANGNSGTGSGSGTIKQALFTGTWGNGVTGTWTLDSNGVWHFATTQTFRNTWGYIFNPYAKEGQNAYDWFWFDVNGNMLTGWQFINGKWYFLNPDKDGTLGACQLGGVTPDGWTVDENGAWIESIPQK